jgi:asparagine synthase (glutamine-hydrolysing)
MCGIAGIIQDNSKQVEMREISNMIEVIHHRGKDHEGVWTSGPVGLGHKRLSILDLSEMSNQPMVLDNGRYSLVYNGEIYNFQELRAELEKNGVIFATSGDTEVLMKSLIFWGFEAIKKLNGMFAFAFVDNVEKRVLLARDRYGIKPLYCSYNSGKFIFASEEKSITKTDGYKTVIDEEALVEYFTFQNIITQRTFFQGISIVPAGNSITIDYSGNSLKCKTQEYWDFNFIEQETNLTHEEYVEEVDRLLTQSIKRQLVADVPLGFYLSGGIDSGCIVATASRDSENINTFTIGFDLSAVSGLELGFDERSDARRISELFSTRHFESVLNSGDMEKSISALCWHLDTPRVGQSYPNYFAASLASNHVKVVLSGTGGDELFAGYPWRYFSPTPGGTYGEYLDAYYNHWQRLIADSDKQNFFRPIWKNVQQVNTKDLFSKVLSKQENSFKSREDYVNQSLYFEAKTFLHGLLNVEDKIHMAHGIENRVPFLDNDLVDFAMKCPVRVKLSNIETPLSLNENLTGDKKEIYFRNNGDGKKVLRELYQRKINGSNNVAVKKGFSAPDSSWFKGQSLDFVVSKILSSNSKISNFIDLPTMELLFNQHLSGKKNRRLLIWSLLSTEYWLEQNL